MIILPLLITALINISFSFERITNYSSTIGVYDFESNGDKLYVASSGGLYVFSKANRSGYLIPNTNNSPDPYTTALCLQNGETLWSGTSRGYLSKRTPPENRSLITTYNSYSSTDWKISDIVLHSNFLVISSNKGISLFDTKKGFAEKSATKLGSLASSKINALSIFNDTLYVGLDLGIAKLRLQTPIEKANFFNPAIWTIDQETIKPVFSFINNKNQCIPYSGFASIFNGGVVHSKDSLLLFDSIPIKTMPSKITAIKVTGKNECWIGTEENYFYLWNGNSFTNYKIPGLSEFRINRVYVDHTGKMWYLPYRNGSDGKWWNGIGANENDNWILYSASENSNFNIGGDLNNRAIIETPDNRVWFGTSGGQIKTYSRNSNSWKFYHANVHNNGSFYSSDSYQNNWGKTDAFAIDSFDYLWLSSWSNFQGSLICYDYKHEPDNSKSNPNETHFRRFFPIDDPNYDKNFTCLHVDKSGNIFAGGEEGNISVFRHNGNPLGEGIQIVKTIKTDSVFDAVTTKDGRTWITTADGMYIYQPDSNKFTLNSEITSDGKALEAENGNIFWIGTKSNGLIRYNIENDEQNTFTTSMGLISNEIVDLSIDKKNGFLWVATRIGFSKLDLGYQVDKSPSSNDLNVFPNPYSKSKMKEIPISITNAPSSANVFILSSDGRLIAKPQLERKSVGSSYVWKPSANINPGLYIVAVKSGKNSGTKKVLITP